MKWDQWRFNRDHNKPVFFIKHLVSIFGCRIDLHKMVAADNLMCFHTHPAHAIRFIIWGGYYDEEIKFNRYIFRKWRLFSIGWIKPSFAHRIHELRNGKSSYSLWIKFRKIAKVQLLGSGWEK